MTRIIASMLLILFSVLLFHGCLSQIMSTKERTKAWMGQPIDKLRTAVLRPESYASRIGWKEKTYKLDNGNWVYVEPDSPGCFIHWEVNPQGIIVGYRLEGKCY